MEGAQNSETQRSVHVPALNCLFHMKAVRILGQTALAPFHALCTAEVCQVAESDKVDQQKSKETGVQAQPLFLVGHPLSDPSVPELETC